MTKKNTPKRQYIAQRLFASWSAKAALGRAMRGRQKNGPRVSFSCNSGQIHPMKGGWVYILTNRRNGTLYIGVTSDLARRIHEHRNGAVEGFTKRYGLKCLVYAERHDDIALAIQREKTLKRWPRAWKVRLIQERNRDWRDLYDDIQ